MTTNYNEYYNNLAINKNVSRSQVYIRCLIRAVKAKNEDKLELAKIFIKQAFTPPSNTVKVNNGALSFWGYHHARYEAFAFWRDEAHKFLTEEEYDLVQDLHNTLRGWSF